MNTIQYNTIQWFLYDIGLLHEMVKALKDNARKPVSLYTFTCPNSTMETPGQGVKSVQS